MVLQIIVRKPISFQKGIVLCENAKCPFGNCIGSGTELGRSRTTFFAADHIPTSLSSSENFLKSPEEQKCNEKMTEIQQVSFVMDDLRLYLDTHPEDREALEMLKNILCQRKKLMSDFAADFYPLTMDCMAEFYEKEPSSACYCWQEGPAPWEGGDC